MGCSDGRAAGAARRRCIDAPRRRQHPAHTGRVVTATPTSRRGCSRMARRASSPRSIASLRPARAPIAPAQKPCWPPARRFEPSSRPEHHLMLHRPAESGNAAVLETMLACGFETEAKDKDQVTPLHRAAMAGHVDAVRVLLKYGADVNARDGMFSAPPLVWAVEGRSQLEVSRRRPRRGRALVDRRGLAPRMDTTRGRARTRANAGRIGGAEAGGRVTLADDRTNCAVIPRARRRRACDDTATLQCALCDWPAP